MAIIKDLSASKADLILFLLPINTIDIACGTISMINTAVFAYVSPRHMRYINGQWFPHICLENKTYLLQINCRFNMLHMSEVC